MVRRSAMMFGLLALALGAISAYAGGDPKKSDGESQRKVSENAQKVEAVAAAYKMAEFGRATKAPELLIAAARVIGTTNSIPEKLSAKSNVIKPLEADEVKEALDLLDEADKLAESTKSLDAIKLLSLHVRKIVGGERGPINGPRYWRGYFPGNQSDWHDFMSVRCRGGEWTYVTLNGNGPFGLDLDLIVTDEETGQTVASDTSVGPNAFVRFYVPFDRDYRIEVRNFSRNVPCFNYNLRAN